MQFWSFYVFFYQVVQILIIAELDIVHSFEKTEADYVVVKKDIVKVEFLHLPSNFKFFFEYLLQK